MGASWVLLHVCERVGGGGGIPIISEWIIIGQTIAGPYVVLGGAPRAVLYIAMWTQGEEGREEGPTLVVVTLHCMQHTQYTGQEDRGLHHQTHYTGNQLRSYTATSL